MREHSEHVIEKVKLAQEIAKDNLENYQNKMKQFYDRSASEPNLKVGDIVYVYTPRGKKGHVKKLMHLWNGPYALVEKVSPTNFKIQRVSDGKMISTAIHVNRMKRGVLRERPGDDVMPEDEIPEDDVVTQEIVESLPEDDNEAVSEDTPQSEEPQAESSDNSSRDNPVNDPNGETKDSEIYWGIERVIKGRYRDGQLEYLIKWKGYKKPNYEPVENLNQETLDYLKENPVKITGRSNPKSIKVSKILRRSPRRRKKEKKKSTECMI